MPLNPKCSCFHSGCKCCPDAPADWGVVSPSGNLIWSPIGWEPSWYDDFGIPQTCIGGSSWGCDGYIWEPDGGCNLQSQWQVELDCIQVESSYKWQWYWLNSPAGRVEVEGSFTCGGCVNDASVDGHGTATIGPLYASNSGGELIYYVKVDLTVIFHCVDY